jgi:hypothetical protein
LTPLVGLAVLVLIPRLALKPVQKSLLREFREVLYIAKFNDKKREKLALRSFSSV